LISFELFSNRKIAIFTAVASLAYWPITAQASFFMSESVFIFLCLLAQLCALKALRRDFSWTMTIVAGLCFGAATIVKTQALAFIITAILVSVLSSSRVRRAKALAVMLIFAALPILLHSAHLGKLLDKDGLYFSANGPFNMYLGQSGREAVGAYNTDKNIYFVFFNNNSYLDERLLLPEVVLTSILNQNFFNQKLKSLWRKNPRRQFLRLGVSALELFTLEPHWPLRNIDAFAEAERIFKKLAVLLIFFPALLALVVALRQRKYREEMLLLMLPVLGMTAAAALTSGQPRYLIPFIPNLIAMATFGWATLLSKQN
jgi:4-amino-4-deoxy-L-arabinose transferase-like glycosyltransferase